MDFSPIMIVYQFAVPRMVLGHTAEGQCPDTIEVETFWWIPQQGGMTIAKLTHYPNNGLLVSTGES